MIARLCLEGMGTRALVGLDVDGWKFQLNVKSTHGSVLLRGVFMIPRWPPRSTFDSVQYPEKFRFPQFHARFRGFTIPHVYMKSRREITSEQ